MCGKKSETISHIVTICEKLAQKEYKRRHDNVGKTMHWKLYAEYNLRQVDNRSNIYLFKVDNRNTRKRCEICSKLKIKTLEQRQ